MEKFHQTAQTKVVTCCRSHCETSPPENMTLITVRVSPPSSSPDHGPCAERGRPLCPHPIRVPCIVAGGRGPAADPEPAGGDEPRGRGPVPGPGSHQLLLRL